MKNKTKTFIIIVLSISLFISTTGIADSLKEKIEVYFNYVNLTVNGEKVETPNMLYDGTTYVPLRKVAEILGKEVGWDGETNTASINDITEKEYYNINDVVVTDDFEITIKSIRTELTNLDKISSERGLSSNSENHLVIIEMEFKNISDQLKYVNFETYTTAYNVEGYEVEKDYLNSEFNDGVRPGMKMKGEIAFEVSKSTKNIILIYDKYNKGTINEVRWLIDILNP